MSRSHFFESTERVCHKYFTLGFTTNLNDLFHGNVLLHPDQAALCQKHYPAVKSRIDGIIDKSHLSILHTHMKQTLHLCQRILFDLFCHVTVTKAKLCLDQHGNQLTGTGLMGHDHLSIL